MRSIGERVGVERERPVGGSGSVGEGGAVDGKLNRSDGQAIGSGARNSGGAGESSAVSGSGNGDRRSSGRNHVNREIRRSRMSGCVLHLHGKGKRPCYRRRPTNAAGSI